jgi:ApaG protein
LADAGGKPIFALRDAHRRGLLEAGFAMNEPYTKETSEIRVSVRVFFLADQSRPEDHKFLWAYQVRIENLRSVAVKLLRRTWHIIDSLGRKQDVHGVGVVGEQPQLEPGEVFEYTSGTPLETPSGFMYGQFHMVEPGSGESFDVDIPGFSLDSPFEPHRVH